MEYLFSYGTLQKGVVQQQLFGRLLTTTNDVLAGYKIFSIEITDDKFLSKGESVQQKAIGYTGNEQDIIEGLVLEVSPEELLHADRYEPENYFRKQVTLVSCKTAWIYTTLAPTSQL